MVTTNDEVGYTKVLSDDGMPHSFAGSCHTHGEWEQSELTHSVRVLGHNGLIDTYTGIVVNITRLRETDNRVDKDVSLALACSADRQFTVGTMHRITSLESDNLAPRELLEVCAKFGGRIFWRPGEFVAGIATRRVTYI